MKTITGHSKSSDLIFRTFKKKYSSRGTIPLQRLTANYRVGTLLGLIPASSDTVEPEDAELNEPHKKPNIVYDNQHVFCIVRSRTVMKHRNKGYGAKH